MFIEKSTLLSGACTENTIFSAERKQIATKKQYRDETIVVVSSSDEEGSEVCFVKATKSTKNCSKKGKARGSSGLRKVELTQVGSVQGGLVKNKSSNRLTTDEPSRRDERGSSFCDILSSSKMSSSRVGDSHSSINLEDEASSDAGASIGDEYSNGGSRGAANHSIKDDCDDDDLDLEQKIRFFFQRIEQQETALTTGPSSSTISDQDCNRSLLLNDSFEFTKLSPQSSTGSSGSLEDPIIGKRKTNGLHKLAIDLDRNLKAHSNLSTLSSTSKRSKLSSSDEELMGANFCKSKF